MIDEEEEERKWKEQEEAEKKAKEEAEAIAAEKLDPKKKGKPAPAVKKEDKK